MAFVAPKFEEIVKRQLSIPFTAALNAGLSQVYVVGPISWRYRVVSVEMVFDYAANNQLLLYWFVSNNRNAGTTLPAGDRNIFAYLSPNNWFVGMGLIKRVPVNYTPDEDEECIKLFANNTSAVNLTVNATITIEEI